MTGRLSWGRPIGSDQKRLAVRDRNSMIKIGNVLTHFAKSWPGVRSASSLPVQAERWNPLAFFLDDRLEQKHHGSFGHCTSGHIANCRDNFVLEGLPQLSVAVLWGF
jgi:hypothetical protein